ncbi:MAG: DUF3619 family protein [Sphaerotilus natans]
MKTAPTSSRPGRPANAEALEARFALRLTARLEAGAQQTPHDIGERLRVARQQAIAQARRPAVARRPEQAVASAVLPVSIGAGGTAALLQSGPPGEDSSLWSRLGWLLPALVLLLGLIGIGEWRDLESMASMAELDAELLGDDLPPSAYADAGFSEFLKRPIEIALPATEAEIQEPLPPTQATEDLPAAQDTARQP